MTAALHNPHGTAFGLMDEVYGPGTAHALRDSGGPWEIYQSTGNWLESPPSWKASTTYRLKPQPPKPREWWVVGGCEAWDNEEEARNYALSRDVVHVREVIE